MATPHVAGAAAILLQQHPGWTGAQLKAALIGAASPNAALDAFEQGGGRLDIDRATQQAVLAAPASLSLGIASFPHSDDPLITRTVRYDNAGTKPVTLSLGASLTGPSGSPAPAGSIAIAPPAITVPAGGSAEVVVTVDTSREGPDGLYSGALTATGDGVRVVTPLGVEREIESHDLTISVRDNAGNPTTVLFNLLGVGTVDAPFPTIAVFNDVLADRATFRLPAGRYMIETLDILGDLTDLIASRVELARDSELVMDGRLAKPFDVDIVGQDLELAALSSTFNDRGTGFVFFTTADRQIATGEIGPDAPPGEVSSELHALLVPPGELAPTVTYHLARQERDHFLTGWKQTLRQRDFATVHASHAGGKGDEVLKRVGSFAPDSLGFTLVGLFYEAPFSRTEHYYAPGFRWAIELEQLLADPEVPELKTIIASSNEVRTLREGRSFDEPWSQAPFGPAFAGTTLFAFRPDLLGAPLRDGDTLFVQPSMFSDQHVPARFVLSVLDEQHARLLADGKVIEQLDDVVHSFPPVSVAPGPAQYRFEQEVTRPDTLFDLSTRVTAAWTFRSRHVDGEPEILALPTLRFTPALDEHNQTDALALVLPVHIERPAGARAPRLAQVSVDASFDDGATWSRVPLLVLGDDAFGVVIHPRAATHVSLRGSAADVAGNQVEQMIIRAYGLAPR
jgi:hypothetical protein